MLDFQPLSHPVFFLRFVQTTENMTFASVKQTKAFSQQNYFLWLECCRKKVLGIYFSERDSNLLKVLSNCFLLTGFER